MNKLISNYHTHTYRCGHALPNPDEDYVLKAIELGYKNLGFSDHAPFKDIIHPGMRMIFQNDFKDYRDSILHLKEKYKDKINIFLGLEIEYMPRYENYYKELLNDYKLDYLIVGQHLTYDENRYPVFYQRFNDDFEGARRYANDLIAAINSGFFSYVCHPDLFLNHIQTLTPEVEQIFEDIALAAKKKNIPLEININGETNNKFLPLKYGCFHYPNINFFKTAKKIGCKFIFGVDAHAPFDFDKIDYDYFDKFLKETGISEEEVLKDLKFIKRP